MEIKQELVPALERLLGEVDIELSIFHRICEFVFRFVTRSESEEIAAPPALSKRFSSEITSLTYVVLEASKSNFEPIELVSFLEDYSSDVDRLQFISESFESHLPEIRERRLQPKGFEFSQLVDLNWRLDYVLKTNKVRQFQQALYTVKFLLRDGDDAAGEEKPVVFTCTVEQLQELLSRMKDAASQVERVLGIE